MKKIISTGLIIIGVGLLVGCPSPSGSDPVATVTGNAIIQSLTMNNISPTSTTTFARALAATSPDVADATAAMADAFSDSNNVPQMVVTLLKNYVGSQSLAIGSTNTFGAAPAIATGGAGDMATFDVGASQIKIVETDSDAQIYWSTTFTMYEKDFPVQIKLALTNFTTSGDPTSYKLATLWINQSSEGIVVNKIKAFNDLTKGEFSKFSPLIAESQFGGAIERSGKLGSGVFRYFVFWDNSNDIQETRMVAAYGNGAGVIIRLGGIGKAFETATYGTSTGLAAALDGSSIPAIPATNLDPINSSAATASITAITAADADWTAAFGASGTFDTELGDASTWF